MTRSYTEISSEFQGYEEITEGKDGWIPLNQRESLSFFHIVGICCSMLAYQIAYSVEFALGSPIMSSLNISTTYQSLIWFSGPLSGFIVQPLIGFYSDITMSRLGRRRPFIIAGAIGIVFGFILIYFVEPIGNALGGSDSGKKTAKIVVFIIALFLTNIAINVLQSPSRTLIGDVVPPAQQQKANTIGSVMLGVAAIITNLIGGLSIAKKLNIGLSDSQFVFIVGAVLIIVGVVITCIVTKEEQLHEKPKRNNPLKEIYFATKTIPKPVLRIAIVYFFSWMAYYPFNIETTDFFGHDIYKGVSSGTGAEKAAYDEGVNFGMLVIAVSNVLVLLYSVVQSKVIEKFGLKLSYAMSQIIEGICLILVFFVKNKYALMAIFAPLGISCTIFNSVPFSVVGLIVPQEQMGIYMGVLNSFAVVGQQCANFALGSGVGAISSRKAPIIGSGAFFAFIAAVMCIWIIVPEQDQEILEPLNNDDE